VSLSSEVASIYIFAKTNSLLIFFLSCFPFSYLFAGCRLLAADTGLNCYHLSHSFPFFASPFQQRAPLIIRIRSECDKTIQSVPGRAVSDALFQQAPFSACSIRSQSDSKSTFKALWVQHSSVHSSPLFTENKYHKF